MQDTTPPEFISVPEDAVVECSDALPYAEPSTNDLEPWISPTMRAAPSELTFTATDDEAHSQTFTVVDTTAAVPADYTVEYDMMDDPWRRTTVTASDDATGNTPSAHTATFNVVDTTDQREFTTECSLPADYTVECSDEMQLHRHRIHRTTPQHSDNSRGGQ